jgi:uncharacterized protein YraI
MVQYPLMQPKFILILLLLCLLVACSPASSPTPSSHLPASASPDPLPSSTTSPTATVLPPTSTITLQPSAGLTLWQVNVRSGPGVYYALLGQINQDQSVQITGQDVSQEWFAILYPSGPDGRGWVTAKYIQADASASLPVLGLVTLPGGTPAPQARLSQKLNVRNGPGTHYDSLGILPVDSIVWLTGRNESGSWLQIDYPSTPGGKGWIIAGYVQVQDILGLPALDSSGTPMAAYPSSQSTVNAITATPTIAPAYQDEDSIEHPGTSQVFSPLGIQAFSYTSDLSAPDGDSLDWIAFHPYTPGPGSPAFLSASLTCNGNGSIQVQLWQANRPLTDWGSLACGDSSVILNLTGGSDYFFRLEITDDTGLHYVLYTLTLHSQP